MGLHLQGEPPPLVLANRAPREVGLARPAAGLQPLEHHLARVAPQRQVDVAVFAQPGQHQAALLQLEPAGELGRAHVPLDAALGLEPPRHRPDRVVQSGEDAEVQGPGGQTAAHRDGPHLQPALDPGQRQVGPALQLQLQPAAVGRVDLGQQLALLVLVIEAQVGLAERPAPQAGLVGQRAHLQRRVGQRPPGHHLGLHPGPELRPLGPPRTPDLHRGQPQPLQPDRAHPGLHLQGRVVNRPPLHQLGHRRAQVGVELDQRLAGLLQAHPGVDAGARAIAGLQVELQAAQAVDPAIGQPRGQLDLPGRQPPPRPQIEPGPPAELAPRRQDTRRQAGQVQPRHPQVGLDLLAPLPQVDLHPLPRLGLQIQPGHLQPAAAAVDARRGDELPGGPGVAQLQAGEVDDDLARAPLPRPPARPQGQRRRGAGAGVEGKPARGGAPGRQGHLPEAPAARPQAAHLQAGRSPQRQRPSLALQRQAQIVDRAVGHPQDREPGLGLHLGPQHGPPDRGGDLPPPGQPQPRRQPQAARRQAQILRLHLQVQGQRPQIALPLAVEAQAGQYRDQLVDGVAPAVGPHPRPHRPERAPHDGGPRQHLQIGLEGRLGGAAPTPLPLQHEIEARGWTADQERGQVHPLRLQADRAGLPLAGVDLRLQARPQGVGGQRQVHPHHVAAQRGRPLARHHHPHRVGRHELAHQRRIDPHLGEREVGVAQVLALDRKIEVGATPAQAHAPLAFGAHRPGDDRQVERRAQRGRGRPLQRELPLDLAALRPLAQQEVHVALALEPVEVDGRQAGGGQVAQPDHPAREGQLVHRQVQRRRRPGSGRRRDRGLRRADRRQGPGEVPAPGAPLQGHRGLLEPDLRDLDPPAQQGHRRKHDPGPPELDHLLALGVTQHHPPQLQAAPAVAEVGQLEPASQGGVHPGQDQLAHQRAAPAGAQRQHQPHRQHQQHGQGGERDAQDRPRHPPPAIPAPHQNASPIETWIEHSPSRTQSWSALLPIPKQLRFTLAPVSGPYW